MGSKYTRSGEHVSIITKKNGKGGEWKEGECALRNSDGGVSSLFVAVTLDTKTRNNMEVACSASYLFSFAGNKDNSVTTLDSNSTSSLSRSRYSGSSWCLAATPTSNRTPIRICAICLVQYALARLISRSAAESPSRFANGGDFLILHFDKGTGGAASAALLWWGLLVGREVEGDEEQEVRGQDTHASEGGEFFACAATGVGHPREIGAREIGVAGWVLSVFALPCRYLKRSEMGWMDHSLPGEVDETEVNDELCDL